MVCPQHDLDIQWIGVIRGIRSCGEILDGREGYFQPLCDPLSGDWVPLEDPNLRFFVILPVRLAFVDYLEPLAPEGRGCQSVFRCDGLLGRLFFLLDLMR